MRQFTLPSVLTLVLCAVGLTGCLGGGGGSPGGGGGPIITPPPTAGINFTIIDGCNDNKGIEYRFFHYRNDYASGRTPNTTWPEDSERVYTRGSPHRLTCNTGQICLGAKVSGGTTGYWGIGIDGDQPLKGECYTCPTSNVVNRRVTLNCSAGGAPGRTNSAPHRLNPIGSQTVRIGETKRIDLTDKFQDPDGDTLSYTANVLYRTTTTVYVTASVPEGTSTLTLTGMRPATVEVRVTARDPGGLSVYQNVHVTATNVQPPDNGGNGNGNGNGNRPGSSGYTAYARGVNFHTYAYSWAFGNGNSAGAAERAALSACSQGFNGVCYVTIRGYSRGCAAHAQSAEPRGEGFPSWGAYYSTEKLTYASVRARVEAAAIDLCEAGIISSLRGTCRIARGDGGGRASACR